MIFTGHIGAGYLAAYVVLKNSGQSLTTLQSNTLLIAGTFIGILPDIDILFFLISKKTFKPKNLDHRHWVHAPVVWLCTGLFIYFLASIHSDPFWKIFGLLLWLCSWTHFICDSIYNSAGRGIAWMWPFSKKQLSLFHKQAVPEHSFDTWRELFKMHVADPLTYLETVITFVGLYVFFFK